MSDVKDTPAVLAHAIEVDVYRREIRIDGVLFPWHVTDEWSVVGGYPALTVSIIADSVKVVNQVPT